MLTKAEGQHAKSEAGRMLTKVLRGGQAENVQSLVWSATGPNAALRQSAPLPKPIQSWVPPRSSLGNEGGATDAVAWQARLQELEQSSEMRIREAREMGFREGEAAGRHAAAAQVQPILDTLARSLAELAELRPKLRSEAETDCLRLALAIARKIIYRELTIDPDSLAGLVKVAVEKIRLQDILRVRIHPQHRESVAQLLARLSPQLGIELVPDPKLDLGGVLIETTRGEWDLSVQTQLKEIERGLTDRLLR